ncbi:hypothetical protein W02_29300 [Nitrospira sp. KM1]|nr:hypothetical protein W02_29300 [Nitrospira sp. KM1]
MGMQTLCETGWSIGRDGAVNRRIIHLIRNGRCTECNAGYSQVVSKPAGAATQDERVAFGHPFDCKA